MGSSIPLDVIRFSTSYGRRLSLLVIVSTHKKKTALTSWTWMNPNHISSICILFIKHQPSSILPSPFLAQPFLYQTQPLFDGLRAGLDFLDTVVVGWWSLKGAQRCWWINMVMIEDVEKKWWGAGHMNPFIYIVVQYVEFKCMIMCIYICIQVVLKDRCCFLMFFTCFDVCRNNFW